MTDLTEQWEKGELPEGAYYCKITLSPCIEEVFLPCVDDKELVVEVLDKKPTYEEYKALLSDIKTLAQTLLKVSPEHREWLETNFKEYL